MMQLLDPTSLEFVLGEMAVVLAVIGGSVAGVLAIWAVAWP